MLSSQINHPADGFIQSRCHLAVFLVNKIHKILTENYYRVQAYPNTSTTECKNIEIQKYFRMLCFLFPYNSGRQRISSQGS